MASGLITKRFGPFCEGAWEVEAPSWIDYFTNVGEWLVLFAVPHRKPRFEGLDAEMIVVDCFNNIPDLL